MTWLALAAGALGAFRFTLSPDYTAISSEKRNHVFYVGESVAFTLSKPAQRYEVRDYQGNVVAAASLVPGSLQIALPSVTAPGWYKLYVYGSRDQGAPWGTSVGG